MQFSKLSQGCSQISYAIKFLNLKPGNMLDEKRAKREVDNLARIPKHPSILEHYGWFKFHCWIIIGMELCNGSMKDLLSGPRYCNLSLLEKQAMRWKIIGQVAESLHVCHRSGLIHRDIKPDNGKNSLLLSTHEHSPVYS
jgi:serine/threonine protein kinase